MIKIETALEIIKRECKTIGVEKVNLLQGLNRVLSNDIVSNDTLPPFDKSAMDGYAIKSKDTILSEVNETVLTVNGLIQAGSDDYFELKSGQAIKIMTGAPVPIGADAVIQIEEVIIQKDSFSKENSIIISKPVKKGTNILKKGEEIKYGDIALKKGKLIRPTEIGLLASLGYSEIDVYKNPKVAIISTGNELLDIDSPLEKGKIRNSNEYSLKALCENLGIDCESFGIAKDEKMALKTKMLEAFRNADIVLTSGGVSVGDFDFVEDVLKEIGATIHFNAVAIKPGKPVTFATIGDKYFFGMPGNPLSLITTFETFVKPSIKYISGVNKPLDSIFKVTALSNFKANKKRSQYIYASISEKEGKYYASDLGTQCSNHLMTMSRANGIIIVDENISEVKAGEQVYGKFIFTK